VLFSRFAYSYDTVPATFVLLCAVITQTVQLYVPVGCVPSRDRWYCEQMGQSMV